MSLLRRDMFRRKLTDLLGKADDERFFLMVWATLALQSERVERARPLLAFPAEAATSDITSKFAVHPWKLETMLNEVLTTPKLELSSNRPNRHLNCGNFGAIAKVTDILTKLENAEDGLTLKRVNVLRELHRIAQRQFEWQRGFLSKNQLYRAAYIYGGDLSKAFFMQTNGFSMNDFSLASFALRAIFEENPIFLCGGGLEPIGIPGTTVSAIFDLISIPHRRARSRAYELRYGSGHTAYKRSLFREFPCVTFGDHSQRVHAPLPDLLTLRATSGLFYDLIKGDDNVRNEISRRFEKYCVELLGGMLAPRVVTGSDKYKVRKNEVDTPDVLIFDEGEISLVIECKATRMSYEARYSEIPFDDAPRAYDEIAKAVFQIWRFASHHRRGLLGSLRLRTGVTGIVLTLDNWLSMSHLMQSDVLERARKMATHREPEIIEVDHIPVTFCTIEDLETTLSTASDASFSRAVKEATKERFQGWQLWSVHDEIAPEVKALNRSPFEDRMGEVLPWCDRFGKPF